MSDYLRQAVEAQQAGRTEQAVHCLQCASPEQASEAERNRALEAALQLLQAVEFQHQWAIAKVLPRFGTAVVAPAVALLEDERLDPETRWFAISVLGEFDDARAIRALAWVCQASEEAELVEAAAQALVRLGRSAVTALTALLQAESHRQLAVRSLAQLCHPASIEPLLGASEDADPAVRAMAIKALGQFRDLRIPPVLTAALADASATVRKQAVAGVASCAARGELSDGTAWLQARLDDCDLAVSQAAARELGRIGTDGAAQALTALLQSPAVPEPLQADAVRALGRIATSPALEGLEAAWPQAPSAVCQTAARELARFGGPLSQRATRVALAWLETEAAGKAAIRQQLALALGELDQAQAFEPLLVLAADPVPAVRWHAIAALGKLPNAAQRVRQYASDSPIHQQGRTNVLADWDG